MLKIKYITVSGLFCALSVVLLVLGNLSYMFSYAAAICCCIPIFIISEVVNNKYALITFISTSILSLFLIEDKESVLLYVLFFGLYPIIKNTIKRINSKILQKVILIIIFNLSIIVVELLTVYLFNIPFDNNYGLFGIIFLEIISNLLFIIFDILFDRFVIIYRKKLNNKIKKYFD